MLKILLLNFTIACIGFGSGTVFLGYIYDGYSRFTDVSTEILNNSVSISMALPAPLSPKMLGMIAYQQYNFWFVWFAIAAFILPTALIILWTFKNYNRFKDMYFFTQLSKFFPPVMAAITAVIIINLTVANVQTANQFKLLIAPLTASLIIRYGFKKNDNGLMLLANVIAIIIITSI